MQTVERKQFSTKSPSQLAEVLAVLQAVLDGRHDELGIPLAADGKGGTIHDALNEAQCVVKEDWVRKARVRWLELGFEEWEAIGLNFEMVPASPWAAHFCKVCGVGMAASTFDHFLTVGYLGEDCNRLIDRWLRLLDAHFRHRFPGALERMREMISRRAHTAREHDPLRDKFVEALLLDHYKLT
jgi:hypothetical protein